MMKPQYYKYKDRALMLDSLLYDLETLLLMDEADQEKKLQKLKSLYRKYKELRDEA